MARTPKRAVTYWASKGGYGCYLGKPIKAHILAKGPDDAPGGPTFSAALERWRKLTDLERHIGTDEYLVSALLNQYRDHMSKRQNQKDYKRFEYMAASFGTKFGHLPVSALLPYHLEGWLGEQDTWNPTTRAALGGQIMSAVKWAMKKGYIRSNPLAGRVDLPSPVIRGREARMSQELCKLLIEEAGGKAKPFGLLLWALHQTGARPIEIRNAAARYFKDGRIVYPWNAQTGYIHKTAKKTQRDRTIYLGDELSATVADLCKLHPTGPIFLTKGGCYWSPTSVHAYWDRLRARPAIVAYCKEHEIDIMSVKMYNFRHTWISEWVDEEGDIYTCAQLTGTSVRMIEKRYGHPGADKVHEKLRAYQSRSTLSKKS